MLVEVRKTMNEQNENFNKKIENIRTQEREMTRAEEYNN